MKKFLCTLLVTVFLATSALATDWQPQLNKQCLQFSEPEIQAQWKVGIKRDFQLDFQRLGCKIDLLDEETKNDKIILAVRISVIVYCLDSNGAKKRVMGSLDAMLHVVDPDDTETWLLYPVQIEKMTVHDGWKDN
jgi:hypothetical protein